MYFSWAHVDGEKVIEKMGEGRENRREEDMVRGTEAIHVIPAQWKSQKAQVHQQAIACRGLADPPQQREACGPCLCGVFSIWTFL